MRVFAVTGHGADKEHLCPLIQLGQSECGTNGDESQGGTGKQATEAASGSSLGIRQNTPSPFFSSPLFISPLSCLLSSPLLFSFLLFPVFSHLLSSPLFISPRSCLLSSRTPRKCPYPQPVSLLPVILSTLRDILARAATAPESLCVRRRKAGSSHPPLEGTGTIPGVGLANFTFPHTHLLSLFSIALALMRH